MPVEKRKIRVGKTKGANGVVSKPQRPSAPRGVKAILDSKLSISDKGKTLKDAEMFDLIDYAARSDAMVKDLAKDVAIIKGMLMSNAVYNEWQEKEGKVGEVKIKGSSSTEMGNVKALAKILKAEGKGHLLVDLTSVKVTDTKKYLGVDILKRKKFMKVHTEEYGSITLKMKK